MVMQTSGPPDPKATIDAFEHPQKHPRGLYTLFFTEMWERASYYGMRAILVFFLTAAILDGGLGMDDKTAAAIYGIYTACVYLFALPGAWIADRLLGLQRSVWYGGIIIAAGHFSMALPWNESFFFGLVLIVLGTGLLKPTISSIVGELYEGDSNARRDAGFSIYYMGINIGAIIGTSVCSWLGQKINWHYGFAASGIGMVLGLAQYHFTCHHLGKAGVYVPPAEDDHKTRRFNRRAWWLVGASLTAFFAFIGACMVGTITLDPVSLAAKGGFLIVALFVGFFAYMYIWGGISPVERKRMWAAAILFAFSALFWVGFEQAGSSFNLFAFRYTDLNMFGWEMPAGWLQNLNPAFIIILAPFFASMWVKLGARNLNPTTPVKFAIGLTLLGAGFGVMAVAAGYVVQGNHVLPTWLMLTYLLHTMGELCISPIALSVTTKLAPKRFAAQMMGLFFMSSAMGNLMAGLLAGELAGNGDAHAPAAVTDMPDMFSMVIWFCLGAAVILAVVLRKPIVKLMSGVK